jgi:putative NIF3 family GTP cyclohydrolase 1 type 2
MSQLILNRRSLFGWTLAAGLAWVFRPRFSLAQQGLEGFDANLAEQMLDLNTVVMNVENLLRRLIGHDLAVYSSHLPLDAHSRLGNNAGLCAALGLTQATPFFESKGTRFGLECRTRLPRKELGRRLERATGAVPRVIAAGPEVCRRIGIVTGGAGSELRRAAESGVDTFITGEGPHWTYAVAEELGINVIYAGPYATETFGVKALAAHLSEKFRLPWGFLDHPTGL